MVNLTNPNQQSIITLPDFNVDNQGWEELQQLLTPYGVQLLHIHEAPYQWDIDVSGSNSNLYKLLTTIGGFPVEEALNYLN